MRKWNARPPPPSHAKAQIGITYGRVSPSQCLGMTDILPWLGSLFRG